MLDDMAVNEHTDGGSTSTTYTTIIPAELQLDGLVD